MLIQDRFFVAPARWAQPLEVPAAPTPLDSFEAADLPPTDYMRAIQQMPRVEKQGHKYDIKARAHGADGSVVLGYADGRGTGYVSLVRPGGAIAWEAALDGVRSVGRDDAGRVHAVTDKEHVRFDADGTLVDRTPVAAEWSQAWVDPSNGKLVLVGKDRSLAGVSGYVQDFAAAPGGRSVYVRTSETWNEVTSSGVSQTRSIPKLDSPNKKIWHHVDEVEPMPDGGALHTIRTTIELAAPHGARLGPGMGMGFDRFGGGFMEPFNGDYLTQITLRRVDGAGEKLWETPNLGDRAHVVVSSDGTVYAASDQPGKIGKPSLVRVANDGTLVAVADLGAPVTSMTTAGDRVVVSHKSLVGAVGPDGALRDYPAAEDWYLKEAIDDERVLVQDQRQQNAAILDLEDGSLTVITDHDRDYSGQRSGEIIRLAQEQPRGEAPTLAIEDEWVIVDNVRVPRRQD